MKKLLMVLTFVFMTLAACFCVDSETLRLTANVTEKSPDFIMKGGFSLADCNTVATQTGSEPLSSSTDISMEPITVYVQLFQSGVAKLNKSFTITVTATPLSNGTISTGAASADTSMFENISNANFTVEGSSSANVASFEFSYLNGKPVNPNYAMGVASFTWAPNPNLTVDNYTASITMEYTAP